MGEEQWTTVTHKRKRAHVKKPSNASVPLGTPTPGPEIRFRKFVLPERWKPWEDSTHINAFLGNVGYTMHRYNNLLIEDCWDGEGPTCFDRTVHVLVSDIEAPRNQQFVILTLYRFDSYGGNDDNGRTYYLALSDDGATVKDGVPVRFETYEDAMAVFDRIDYFTNDEDPIVREKRL